MNYEGYTPLNYDDLAAQLLMEGGFTTDLRNSQPIRGYAVALPGQESRERVVHPAQVADAIYVYVVNHGRDLRGGFYLGAWLDGNEVVLDLVTVEDDLSDALLLARAGRQQAIYDLATREEIRV